MNQEVEDWLNQAKETQEAIKKATRGFEKLSDTYADIRNVGYKNDEKEAIDEQYSKLYELHQKLCELQAGGSRKMKSRFSRKNRRSNRKSTRRQRGGAAMKLGDAIKKLQAIEKKVGSDVELFRDVGNNDLEDIRSIYHSDEGGWNKVIIE